ncbi:ubiquitin carboxyl-terminal hydrolase 9/24, partial [Aphelenchoides avenae]
KVTATKRLLIDRAHRYLLLQLKRFSFYIDHDDYYVAVKYRDRISFPTELDFWPFTTDGDARPA